MEISFGAAVRLEPPDLHLARAIPAGIGGPRSRSRRRVDRTNPGDNLMRSQMKASCKWLPALLLLLAPAASYAVNVPIPIEGATLNVSLQLQTQVLVNEAGSPDGTSPSYDLFVRRSRVLINGDINGRAIVQDAWIGWAPTGIKGGTVVYVDAGILLIPISHHLLESTTNFITADAQVDAFRFP